MADPTVQPIDLVAIKKRAEEAAVLARQVAQGGNPLGLVKWTRDHLLAVVNDVVALAAENRRLGERVDQVTRDRDANRLSLITVYEQAGVVQKQVEAFRVDLAKNELELLRLRPLIEALLLVDIQELPSALAEQVRAHVAEKGAR